MGTFIRKKTNPEQIFAGRRCRGGTRCLHDRTVRSFDVYRQRVAWDVVGVRRSGRHSIRTHSIRTHKHLDAQTPGLHSIRTHKHLDTQTPGLHSIRTHITWTVQHPDAQHAYSRRQLFLFWVGLEANWKSRKLQKARREHGVTQGRHINEVVDEETI